MKRPLIVNFNQLDQSLIVDLLVNWCDGQPILYSIAGELVEAWLANGWPELGQRPHFKKRGVWFKRWLWFSLPYRQIIWRRRLAKLMVQSGIDSIICLSWLDKLILTGPARRLGLIVVWLQLPEETTLWLPRLLFKKYRRQASMVKLISYGRHLIDHLRTKDNKLDNCRLLWPAINPTAESLQADLFDSLAEGYREATDKKFFVIGAVIDLVDNQAAEILLRSLKIVLSVIPSVQLVIIGDGDKRKELQWLAKQLDLANLVWFVGRQEPLDKWFRSLDALIELSVNCSIDWQRLLRAMAVGLPIIVPKNKLTNDFLMPGQTALVVEQAEPEMLAQAVIQLQQDKILAGRLSWQGRQWIEEFGLLNRQIADFITYTK